MFANGPGTHSALRTSQIPESAANQLKGCRSNQMQSATKPASAVLLFTTYLTAGSAQLKTSCTLASTAATHSCAFPAEASIPTGAPLCFSTQFQVAFSHAAALLAGWLRKARHAAKLHLRVDKSMKKRTRTAFTAADHSPQHCRCPETRWQACTNRIPKGGC
jgi:hypothetical protein